VNEYTTSPTFDYHDSIDASAEREGIAALELEVLTGVTQPVPAVLRKSIEASDPRCRKVAVYRYPRGTFLRRWFAALDAIENRRPVPRTRLYFDSRADLSRRRADHERYGRTIRRPNPRGANGKFVTAA
jgi:hypothetical protein